MSAISCRIPSRASQYRSISALSSDSVGSIMRVPATGHDMAQEMGRMALEPQGAALMVPSELLALTACMGTTGWLGRKGASSLAHLGVHVGAVQVHLASVLVDEITYVSDLLLKHAEGGRCLEVCHVDVAVLVHLHHLDLHAGHLSAGRVGAVGRLGDQADLEATGGISTWKNKKSRERHRLELYICPLALVCNRPAEVLLQLSEENLVAVRLIQRHEGVDVGKLPPGLQLNREDQPVEDLVHQDVFGRHAAADLQSIEEHLTVQTVSCPLQA
ncbi:hypothetical protein EYF80_045726 [Liparis tanakae]|uniref:Uncharacterized protein n=1 Tax=Liparis tanakae TaxID=230148 RepID=A0A4Z2FSD2_9TELE|nr:hypothetical protein EYF80_045726 [Liparis tanakae]